MASSGVYAKGVARREEILAAALDVIARRGYHGASVREIADAVGLSQPGLLHYFESKDALFEAVLQKRDAADVRSAAAAATELFAAIVALVQHNQQVPGLVQLYVQQSAAASDLAHPSRPYFEERYRNFLALLAEEVRLGQAEGTITDAVQAESLASMIAAVLDGLQLQWLLGVQPDMAARLEELAALLRPRS